VTLLACTTTPPAATLLPRAPIDCASRLWTTTELECAVGADASPPPLLAGSRGLALRELRSADVAGEWLEETIALDWLPSCVLAALWCDPAPSLGQLVRRAGLSIDACPLVRRDDDAHSGDHGLRIRGIGIVGQVIHRVEDTL
jgi:hypothetical protein